MTNRTDNFTRADSAVSLGTPSDGGAAWVALGGTWGIDTNRAYSSAGSGGEKVAYLESSEADVTVQVTLATGIGSEGALAARIADLNNYLVVATTGSAATLYKCVAGAYTSLGSASHSFVDGDVLALVLAGSAITFKINGTTAISATDSAGATNTKHGLRVNGTPSLKFAAFSIVGAGGGAPVITGPSGAAGAATSTKTVAETSTAVHTFTADVAVTWSINGGADAAAFAINPSTGALTFAAAPSYETPTDLGDTAGNNTYVVVVRATATSGGATADQTVTVTVSNVAEPPLAPTIGTATAGDQTVSIAFTAPTNTGKPSITGYTATLSPGGITKAGASSPIVFGAGDGIVNGTAYTGVVKATNSEGTGPDSAASNSVTPSAGGGSVKVPTVLLSRLLTPRS